MTNPLLGMSTTTTFAALIVFVLCSGGQIVHGYLRTASYRPSEKSPIIVYESAILVHLLLMALLTFEGMQGGSELWLHIPGFSIPFAPLLWLNVGVLAVMSYALLTGLGDNSVTGPQVSLRWMPPVEALFACASLPIAVRFLGESWMLVMYADAVYFMFRTTYLLLFGMQVRANSVTQLSVIEALKSMPEGLLYSDDKGRTLVANDAMRHCLTALDLPTDFANVDDLLELLREKSAGENAVEAVRGLQREDEPWLFLRISPNEVRLFSFEGWAAEGVLRFPSVRSLEGNPAFLPSAKRIFGALPNKRIFAYDVTQEVETLKAINRTNAKLAAQHSELEASMETVREAAENEAMLRMRGRVHDVIGQRLSMLHRALEDDAVSDEKLEQLKPLLNGILDDLAIETDIEPADELAATVAAFSLTGVTVSIDGTLPDDPAKAKAYADCIREASTNAVKHARSTEIVAKITPEGLSISNDGPLPVLPVNEGTGLSNMRHAAATIGASFEIEASEPPFTIRLVTQ